MNNIPQSYRNKPLVHAWVYSDKDGVPFGVVGRYEDGNSKKDIVPFFKRNGDGFNAGIDLDPRPLFGLDKLAIYPKDKMVLIVEGEKSAAALQQLGICAVTSLGGSSSALLADWMPLNGYKEACILPDNDAPGNTMPRMFTRRYRPWSRLQMLRFYDWKACLWVVILLTGFNHL